MPIPWVALFTATDLIHSSVSFLVPSALVGWLVASGLPHYLRASAGSACKVWIAGAHLEKKGKRIVTLTGSWAAVMFCAGMISWFFNDWATALPEADIPTMQGYLAQMFPHPLPNVQFPPGQEPPPFVLPGTHPTLTPQPALVPLQPYQTIGGPSHGYSMQAGPSTLNHAGPSVPTEAGPSMQFQAASLSSNQVEPTVPTLDANTQTEVEVPAPTQDASTQTDAMPTASVTTVTIASPVAAEQLLPVFPTTNLDPNSPLPEAPFTPSQSKTPQVEIGQSRSPNPIAIPENVLTDTFMGSARSLAARAGFDVDGVMFMTFSAVAAVHGIKTPPPSKSTT